jgi:indole-3-glycerol phosphate synthase
MAVLEDILAATRRRVEEARAQADMRALTMRAQEIQARGFGEAVRRVSEKGPAVIAELKHASPSKGVLRGSYHVARMARDFEAAGAAALSVLTEPDFFQGSLADTVEASAAAQLPILRKDFIVEEFQLVEAKVNGADAVLLIVAALDEHKLAALHARAHTLGLDVLVEVHDKEELERALGIGATIIGVNGRDLKTMEVDPERPLRLVDRIPGTVVRVAESGITSGQQIRRLRAAGFEAFLIGEALMRAEWPGKALRELLAEADKTVIG